VDTRNLSHAQKKYASLGYELFFSDECHSSLQTIIGKTWAKKGETPILKVPQRRTGMSLIAAMSQAGEVICQQTQDSMNTLGFIGFLQRVLDKVEGQVVVFVDNHRMHKTQQVLDFVAGTDGKLVLEYTPTYAPECNPIEWLWSYGKGLLKMRVIHTIEELCEFWGKAIQMAQEQKLPDKFFKNSAIGGVC
jgi:putative transposase